jgi:hypothetical protein
MTGQEIDYNKHVRLEFSEYVQTHEEHDSTMTDRTIGVICLGLTGNERRTHWFMCLASGSRITGTDGLHCQCQKKSSNEYRRLDDYRVHQ